MTEPDLPSVGEFASWLDDDEADLVRSTGAKTLHELWRQSGLPVGVRLQLALLAKDEWIHSWAYGIVSQLSRFTDDKAVQDAIKVAKAGLTKDYGESLIDSIVRYTETGPASQVWIARCAFYLCNGAYGMIGASSVLADMAIRMEADPSCEYKVSLMHDAKWPLSWAHHYEQKMTRTLTKHGNPFPKGT